MFRPVGNNRLAAEIIEQIEAAIIRRRLKPGDRLPSLRELQKRFRASLGAVREALGILKERGLIEIRKGSRGGAIVKDLGTDQVSESLGFLIRFRRVSVMQLAEFRESVEAAAAGLAAERATPADIETLKALYAEAARLLEEGPQNYDEFYRLEIEMHRYLARLSSNPVFEWVLGTILLNIGSYRQLLGDKSEPEEALEDWAEMLEALEKGEASRLSSVMRSHVVRFNRRMREKDIRADEAPGFGSGARGKVATMRKGGSDEG